MKELNLLFLNLEVYYVWLLVFVSIGGFIYQPAIKAVKRFYNEYPQTVFVLQCIFLIMMIVFALSIPINEFNNIYIEPKSDSSLVYFVSDLIQNFSDLVSGVMVFLLDNAIFVLVVSVIISHLIQFFEYCNN